MDLQSSAPYLFWAQMVLTQLGIVLAKHLEAKPRVRYCFSKKQSLLIVGSMSTLSHFVSCFRLLVFACVCMCLVMFECYVWGKYLCMPENMCVHIYMCPFVFVCVSLCLYVTALVCLYLFMYVFVRACIYVCMYACMNVCM